MSWLLGELIYRSQIIKPSVQLDWREGLGNALKRIGATQSDPYSWIAIADEHYIFTAEIDHVDSKNNRYNHMRGTFKKFVSPLTTGGNVSAQTIRHAQELLNAIQHAYSDKIKCQLLLVKGTKYGTSGGKVRAALDGHSWIVEQCAGTVESGFYFILVRTE